MIAHPIDTGIAMGSMIAHPIGEASMVEKFANELINRKLFATLNARTLPVKVELEEVTNVKNQKQIGYKVTYDSTILLQQRKAPGTKVRLDVTPFGFEKSWVYGLT